MTTQRILATIAALALATPALAAGDVAKGEAGFKKCKACHMIADGDNVIFKGGKTGPNLYGVIGRQAGSVEGFRYGNDLVAAGEAGLVWNEENLVSYLADPKKFLQETLGDGGAKSKMSFKLTKGAEDVVAYLASVGAAQ
ncbi:Cytochrome c-551 precursor [Pseudoruegeria aquimaris]|uniref:Cytochrome c-551 n=1 Tax=Pseudoruegeria aquimaris TaxID=393663 RepID=A0A1Y5S8K8_9RHOB|nr:c-type cytochrome [Pseudoruegeria aquimaris]SLN34807.1 Cytochrome c-551 precursor [Pseudoruegeria aquimaris]